MGLEKLVFRQRGAHEIKGGGGEQLLMFRWLGQHLQNQWQPARVEDLGPLHHGPAEVGALCVPDEQLIVLGRGGRVVAGVFLQIGRDCGGGG